MILLAVMGKLNRILDIGDVRPYFVLIKQFFQNSDVIGPFDNSSLICFSAFTKFNFISPRIKFNIRLQNDLGL